MMMKQFETTLIILCQIDSDCVMGFRDFFQRSIFIFFLNLFFSSTIA